MKNDVVLCGTGVHLPDDVNVRAECGHDVWASPEAVKFHDENDGTTYLCFTCYIFRDVRLAMELSGADISLVPGTLEKIRQHLGPEAVEDVVKFIAQANRKS